VGDGVVISYGSLLSKASIQLGDHVYIGAYSLLGDVEVGAETLIADHVCIPSGPDQHGLDRLDVPIREQAGSPRTIHIGCDSWIGSGSIVMADVGSHCVVGAGSVVTKPVEDYKIVAGNPARVIGDRREKAAV
jgi:acetyltransferase-like isoleucine patch superfamily enzyme